jgi:hypothetical protein
MRDARPSTGTAFNSTLPRSAKLMKRSRLKPISDKQRARLRERARAKREAGAVRCGFPGCTVTKVDWHHKKKRSRGGSDDPSNRVWLCRGHHRWVEEHDEAARAMGLSLRSWEPEPDQVRDTDAPGASGLPANNDQPGTENDHGFACEET